MSNLNDHALEITLTYHHGGTSAEVMNAVMTTGSEEGARLLTQLIASFLISGAEEATVSDGEGTVLYHEDRRTPSTPSVPESLVLQ